MQFFKKRTKMPSSGSQNTDNHAAESSDSRNKRQSLTAAVISVLITACLLTACGFFVVSGLSRKADSHQQDGSPASGPSAWLGLEPVTRILSPDSEDPVAYTFSDGTDPDPSQKVMPALIRLLPRIPPQRTRVKQALQPDLLP